MAETVDYIFIADFFADIQHNDNPVYLETSLDRSLKQQCLKTKLNVGARNNLLHRLTITIGSICFTDIWHGSLLLGYRIRMPSLASIC